LRQSLAEGAHALSAIVASAPADDENMSALVSLHKRLLAFKGTVDLLAPPPARSHTVYGG
jgi:hypothetical protein